MEFMSTLQSGLDQHKPSLFEILSENQLADLIPPTLRYLLRLITQRHPRYLLRIFNSFDEIYALLMLLVERHSLLTYGGGFTEHFYGLKRERVLPVRNGLATRTQLGAPSHLRDTLKLRDSDIWKNLTIMVGIPYLKRKLDESYNVHAPQAAILGSTYHRDESLPTNASLRQRVLFYYKWFLRKVYPSVSAAYYFAILAFNLAYLFDNTQYPSPFLWLVGTRIRRMGDADYRAIVLAAQTSSIGPSRGAPPRRPRPSSSWIHPVNLMYLIKFGMLSNLRFLLPTSILALKFLEWWHASDFARQISQKAAEGLSLPPPIVSGPPKPNAEQANKLNHAAGASSNGDATSPPATPTRTSTRLAGLDQVSAVGAGSPNVKAAGTDLSPAKPQPPISTITHLPIFTVAAPTAATASFCPICLHPIQTATSAQTGFVYCYTCIFKWVGGTHSRQVEFMQGEENTASAWHQSGDQSATPSPSRSRQSDMAGAASASRSRHGKWESGKGRCAVTGRRLLGGTAGLRRIMV